MMFIYKTENFAPVWTPCSQNTCDFVHETLPDHAFSENVLPLSKDFQKTP